MRNRIVFISFFILILFISVIPSNAQEIQDNQEEQNLVEAARVMRESGRAQFNFSDIEIVTFIRFMSELLNENIVVPPSIKGNISVISPRSVSIDQARQIMLSVLEMNGLTLQDMGGYSKVESLKQGAASENIVRRGRAGPGTGEEVVAQVVPLHYVTSDFIAEAVKQVSGKSVNIFPMGTGNEILLSGRASDVNRAVSLIQTIDVAGSVRKTESVSLENASARLVAAHLSTLAKDNAGPLFNLVALADEASSQVILVGERDTLAEAKILIKALDIPAQGGDFHVYRLKNADAPTVAEQLSQILDVASRLQPGQQDGAATPTTVVADIPTNSLIFAVSQSQFQSIMNIIEQIDIQPRQVMLRGLIAEVNLTKLDNAGIDWATWGGTIEGNLVMAAEAQLGDKAISPTILEYFRDITKTEEIFSGTNQDYKITKYEEKGLLYAYVNLLNKFDAINVLSMPRILCTDNTPSQLQVGQVIPQLSSRVSDITNPNSVQNSFEYKDTGLILNVTPHIRSGNLVSLEIEQTTEDVLTAMTTDTPVTAKRKIQTTVQVADSTTVILGGLIKEAEKSLKRRVPGLSYIPVLGNLFTRTVKQREKIELMVFLTPYILEKPSDADQFTKDIVSGKHGLSEAEKKLQERLEREFEKVVEKEGK